METLQSIAWTFGAFALAAAWIWADRWLARYGRGAANRRSKP